MQHPSSPFDYVVRAMPVADMERLLARIGRILAALPGPARAHDLHVRQLQACRAVEACARFNFGSVLRRALEAKVRLLDEDVRAYAMEALRRRHG